MTGITKSSLLLPAAFVGALLLIVLHSWGIEETWIKPSLAPREDGATGRAQWGGMIPEFKNPPRIFLDNDPYYWMRYAQQVARGETLRVRFTDLDNVPYGREVHWNSGWVWWMVGGGWITALLTGETWHDGIETWGLYATPALFLVVLAAVAWWVRRRLGAAYAAALVFVLAAFPAVMWDFGYARPDHHGMHNTAALVLLLGWAFAGGGWVAASKRRAVSAEAHTSAQHAMTIAAVAAAAGLWVGATQMIFVLVGAGAGLFAALLLRGNEHETLDPSLFRWWGKVAALTALGFYALEYAPHHFGMRLEVNHPIYAAALWGAGELLAVIAAWRRGDGWPQGGGRLRLALALAALAIPALALGLGPESWHAMKDGPMRRQHEFINEFEPFTNSLRDQGLLTVMARFGLLPLLIPGGILLALTTRLPAAVRASLLTAAGAATVTGAMLFVQVRWAGLFSIALTCLTVAVLHSSAWLLNRSNRLQRWRGWILGGGYAIVVAPLIVFFAIGFSNKLGGRETGRLDPTLVWTIASRDLAFNLKRLAQLGPVRVMSGPGQTPSLHFYGDVRGTAALYWENTQGVREAAEFFADQGDETARRIARERGITHVVLQQDTSLAESSVRIALGETDPDLVENSLAFQLCNPLGEIPDWLEPVPFYGSPMASGFQMRILRVRPDKL